MPLNLHYGRFYIFQENEYFAQSSINFSQVHFANRCHDSIWCAEGRCYLSNFHNVVCLIEIANASVATIFHNDTKLEKSAKLLQLFTTKKKTRKRCRMRCGCTTQKQQHRVIFTPHWQTSNNSMLRHFNDNRIVCITILDL